MRRVVAGGIILGSGRAVHRPGRAAATGRFWCWRPTGKAVDVAVREGAGDTGYTIAKALHSLQNDTLRLGQPTW